MTILSISLSRWARELEPHEPASSHAGGSSSWHVGARGRTWLLAVFLWAVFALATQDLNAPHVWRDDGAADIAGWVKNVEQGQARRQAAFLALGVFGAAGVFLPARHGRTLRPDWLLIWPLVVLIAWAYLSLLWSHDRPLTVKRLVVFTSLWLATAAIVKHFRLRDVIFTAAFFGTASLLLGVAAEANAGVTLAAALRPGFRWAGSMHPNHTGISMSLLVLSMLYFAATSRRPACATMCLAVAVLAVFVLLATRSRTALAATLAAGAVFTILRVRPAQGMLLAAGGAIALAMGTFLYQSQLLGPVWEALLLGRAESNVRTLTGRTEIWSFAAGQLTADPSRLLMGFGHDSFWTPAKTEAISRQVGFTISEAHNAYLEAALNLGMVGAALFAVTLLVAAGRWYGARRTRLGRYPAEAAFAVAWLCYAVLHGLIESTMAHAQFWTLVAFACVGCAALHGRRGDPMEVTP